MKTNLEQRLAVALVSTEHADGLLAKCAAPAALSAAEKAALSIALADKKAADEVEKVLLARADVSAKAAAKTEADAAKVAADAAAAADEEDEALAAAAAAATVAATAAADALTAAQAAKAAMVPISRNARDRITVALADKKAGDELIAKIEA